MFEFSHLCSRGSEFTCMGPLKVQNSKHPHLRSGYVATPVNNFKHPQTLTFRQSGNRLMVLGLYKDTFSPHSCKYPVHFPFTAVGMA